MNESPQSDELGIAKAVREGIYGHTHRSTIPIGTQKRPPVFYVFLVLTFLGLTGLGYALLFLSLNDVGGFGEAFAWLFSTFAAPFLITGVIGLAFTARRRVYASPTSDSEPKSTIPRSPDILMKRLVVANVCLLGINIVPIILFGHGVVALSFSTGWLLLGMFVWGLLEMANFGLFLFGTIIFVRAMVKRRSYGLSPHAVRILIGLFAVFFLCSAIPPVVEEYRRATGTLLDSKITDIN